MCILLTEPTQYDLRENVPGFAALLQAQHHQKRARTKTPLQVSVPISQSLTFCLLFTKTSNIIVTASPLDPLRFLKLPLDIRKQQVDADGSPEHTPPQDGDFPRSSPTYKFHESRFEISPDRSPQPPPTGAPVR